MTNHPKPTDEKQLNFNESNMDFFMVERLFLFQISLSEGRNCRCYTVFGCYCDTFYSVASLNGIIYAWILIFIRPTDDNSC